MLPRLAYRLATEISPRLALKAGYLWCMKGARTLSAYKRRVRNDELFPPFLFFALTDACNLRCRGCWIETGGTTHQLSEEDVDSMIAAGKQRGSYFYTLLGGEPMIYPKLWNIIEKHTDCYFQIITNGMFFSEENAQRLRAAGNVTPLVSIDGLQEQNDARRGDGTFDSAMQGLEQLQRQKILYGVATTVTGKNLDEVVTDEYVQQFIDRGPMYLWYYVFRPVGANPSPELCVEPEQILELRRRLLQLRRKHPIILIDTYWNAAGQAVCPAALGMGFHIGPQGSIEPCPPLSFAKETIHDNQGDLYKTINESEYLRGFQKFVKDRTRGCVILECPQELVDYIKDSSATDYSGRDALAEIAAGTPRGSHHIPGEEIPEDYWFYKLLKKQLFFGMGGYG